MVQFARYYADGKISRELPHGLSACDAQDPTSQSARLAITGTGINEADHPHLVCGRHLRI